MTRTRYLDWLARDLETPAQPDARAEGVGPDLVIGYATGYGPRALAPFVRSLRQHSQARVALVASPAKSVKAFLRENNVDRFDAPKSEGWRPHLLIARFKHYLSILDAYPDARRVLICDVRDLTFQADPFAKGFGDDEAPLVFYAETAPGQLGAHGANPRWLDSLVGAPLARKFDAGAAVCGGTIMGEPHALKRAIRILLTLCAIPRPGALDRLGADQAALNVIAHWGMADVMVAPNYARVATIGYAEPPVLRGGVLWNPTGTMSPILHQYDRHAFAKEAVETRWTQGLPADPPRRKPSAWARFETRLIKSIGKRLPEWR